MKGQLDVSTPAEYIAELEEPRKTDVAALDALIRKTAPKLEASIQMGMLAYGRQGELFRMGLASNKNYISLYVCDCDRKSIAENYKQALPKANIGRSCVRFRRLSDLDQGTLVKMIRESAKGPAKA